MFLPVTSYWGRHLMSDYVWTSIVCLLLLIYLLYALIKPEKF